MNNTSRCPMCNGTLPNNISALNSNLNNSSDIENIRIDSNTVNTNENSCDNLNCVNTNINANENTINRPNRIENNLNLYNNNFWSVIATYIGKKCTCEFDTNRNIEVKTGILESVGNDFISLKSLNTSKTIFCNTSNLLFITVNS